MHSVRLNVFIRRLRHLTGSCLTSFSATSAANHSCHPEERSDTTCEMLMHSVRLNVSSLPLYNPRAKLKSIPATLS
jgi:hypothetical protein